MPQHFQPGDFLVFQLEAGFALLRVLGVDTPEDDPTWHVAAYYDLFPDVDNAEAATAAPEKLSVSHPHIALTNRAFESTQVARISSSPLTEADKAPLDQWRTSPAHEISDRSVRLLMGLR